jgi:hypothetical protein
VVRRLGKGADSLVPVQLESADSGLEWSGNRFLGTPRDMCGAAVSFEDAPTVCFSPGSRRFGFAVCAWVTGRRARFEL